MNVKKSGTFVLPGGDVEFGVLDGWVCPAVSVRSPDVEALAAGVWHVIEREPREYDLLLRAASGSYAHLESRVRIPLGEGLTGWVAQTRRSGFIKEHALDDPRVRRAENDRGRKDRVAIEGCGEIDGHAGKYPRGRAYESLRRDIHTEPPARGASTPFGCECGVSAAPLFWSGRRHSARCRRRWRRG